MSRHMAGRMMQGAWSRLAVTHTPATLINSYSVTSSSTAGTNKVTASGSSTFAPATFTPAVGELIVVKVSGWDTTVTWATPTATGLTFALAVASTVTSGDAGAAIFAATVSVSQSITPSVVFSDSSATAAYASMTVERWTAGGIGNTAQAPGVAATPWSVNCTAASTSSAISWIGGDYNGVAVTAVTYANAGNTTAVNTVQANPNNYSVYTAWTRPPAAGAVQVGTTAPTGQKTSLAALEILGT